MCSLTCPVLECAYRSRRNEAWSSQWAGSAGALFPRAPIISFQCLWSKEKYHSVASKSLGATILWNFGQAELAHLRCVRWLGTPNVCAVSYLSCPEKEESGQQDLHRDVNTTVGRPPPKVRFEAILSNDGHWHFPPGSLLTPQLYSLVYHIPTGLGTCIYRYIYPSKHCPSRYFIP